jgi:hypothetical protein
MIDLQFKSNLEAVEQAMSWIDKAMGAQASINGAKMADNPRDNSEVTNEQLTDWLKAMGKDFFSLDDSEMGVLIKDAMDELQVDINKALEKAERRMQLVEAGKSEVDMPEYNQRSADKLATKFWKNFILGWSALIVERLDNQTVRGGGHPEPNSEWYTLIKMDKGQDPRVGIATGQLKDAIENGRITPKRGKL